MRHAAAITLALWSGWAQLACKARGQNSDESGPAPVDTAPRPPSVDPASPPDTAVATPPITPAPSATPRDTPPGGAQQPTSQGVSKIEYEGWRQYSVNCARCHGQDVLPNPVAANLLISLAAGGSMASEEKFIQVVSEGRPDRGMPAFKSIMSPEQIKAVYAYVKGRADKRIPPGRPAEPKG
jgi:mono/diheme cytochrome c family protein